MARSRLSGNYGKLVTVELGDAETSDPVPVSIHAPARGATVRILTHCGEVS